jgi:hypothetical protein
MRRKDPVLRQVIQDLSALVRPAGFSSCLLEAIVLPISPNISDERALLSPAILHRKNNLLFARMSYAVDVVKQSHAFKSADKHRSHPSMHLKAWATAIRCWSDR